MKNKFAIVFKNSFVNTYKLRSLTKRKILLILLLVIYVAASIFMMLNEFFDGVYKTLSQINLNHYYLTIIFSITSIFSFFFTIFSAKNALFENKDNDLLFSLPIRKTTILFSRLSSILLYNFFLGLFIIIPGICVYVTNASLSIHTFIIISLLTLFSSVIPTVLSSLFGYLIAFITSKSKNKNLIELISYMLFIGIYLLVFYNGDVILKLFINNLDLLNKVLRYVFFPIYLINLSITKLNFIYIVLYVMINIGILFLFIFILDKIYYKIIIKLKIEKTNSNFKMKKLNLNSPMSALIKKEVERYFSSAIYVFNTSFGVIILVIVSIASFFYDSKELLSIVESEISLNSFMMVFYLLLFVVGLSGTTNSSLSIERNNFWILKMLPLTPKEVFRAKKCVNLILLIPTILLSLILFLVSGYIKFPEMIILFSLNILFSIIIANFGLICNLLFPKFDAPNDTVIVKQSISSLMGIMIPLVFLILYVIVIDYLNITQNLILMITLIIFIVFTMVTTVILNTWGIDKYRKLS